MPCRHLLVRHAGWLQRSWNKTPATVTRFCPSNLLSHALTHTHTHTHTSKTKAQVLRLIVWLSCWVITLSIYLFIYLFIYFFLFIYLLGDSVTDGVTFSWSERLLEFWLSFYANAGPINHRQADIWSLGITTLELAKTYAPYAKEATMKVSEFFY